MLNKSSDAAIAAMSRLAEVHGGEHSSQTAAEIARARDLPQPFIAKVLTLLSRRGLVRGTQGRRGGYALARKPTEISLYDIASCFGRLERSLGCPFGPRRCQKKAPCPLHHDLVGIQDRLRAFLEGTTLAVFCAPAASAPARRRRGSRASDF
jgi:Rrf2 family protein